MTDKTPPPVATPDEVAALRKEQESEYGTWVAVQPIQFNGVLAYLPGEPVPVSNVARYGYDQAGLVAKQTTKAGQEVIVAVHEAAQNTGPTEVAPPVSLSVPIQN